MLSKSQLKLITSLKQKKFRSRHQLFVAEGIKTVSELLNSSFQLYQLYTITNEFDVSDDLITFISEDELKKISFLKSPNTALALFKMNEPGPIDNSQLIVALDDINDPGNLGTIIRLCDWFGVRDLICSPNSVDCFNPKVIQAAMGSIARVNITYTELVTCLTMRQIPKFGAFMNGENVYEMELPDKGVLVLGNEANGISKGVEQLIDHKISIPRFGQLKETESLNVANATAILLSEFKRRLIER